MEELLEKALKELDELKHRVSILEKRNRTASSIENLEPIRKYVYENFTVSDGYILAFVSNEDICKEVSEKLDLPDSQKTKRSIGLILAGLGAEKTISKVGGNTKRGYFLARKI